MTTHTDRPVVLFLPAHNEEAAVGAVVARVPERVCGHPVVCLVVDDGSTDRTAHRARAAGARVLAFERNRGLGAAVRRGLAAAVAENAAAVAFCDADGEYAPEELCRLVAPILAGEADYVVGSRFTGTIEHMLWHRRLGNRALTAGVRLLTGAPISDGQSGYRALSPAAATQARIIHDFNYAQVLTLDLLARGVRYHEVPISYRFRETGESFVRLGSYLATVVPAVIRQRRIGAGSRGASREWSPRVDQWYRNRSQLSVLLDHLVGRRPTGRQGAVERVEQLIVARASQRGPGGGDRGTSARSDFRVCEGVPGRRDVPAAIRHVGARTTDRRQGDTDDQCQQPRIVGLVDDRIERLELDATTLRRRARATDQRG
ncbi:hypothetical protein BH23ACT10_BH23ACT10_02940 [soil metagenome]